VSLVPFILITFGGAAASLFTRRRPRLSISVGLGALIAAAVAALAIEPGDILSIGDGALVGSAYIGLFGVTGAIAGALLCALALATSWQRNLPASILAILGSSVVALSLPDPTVAAIAALAGGLAGVLVTVVAPITGRSVAIAARELRALAIAGALAIVATAWVARPLGPIEAQPVLLGLAYLGFALAVAVRFGAIPFHAWAARLADSAPEPALPFLMAWGPATLGVVALAWSGSSVVPFAEPLGLERGLVLAVAAATLLLGAFAAWIQDDVEHVVGYSIVQDAGFVLLALASLDPAAWEPARAWIIVFVLAKSAFAGWAVAVRTAYGTRRIPELSGWARRSPLLGLALVAIAAASVGWPGLVVWEARGTLVDLAIDGPLEGVVAVGAFAAIAYYVRLLAVGVGRPSAAVIAGARPWPERPPREAIRAARRGPSRAAGDVAVRLATARAGARQVLADLEPLWRLNRTPIAAAIVLALAVSGLVVAAGGFGVAEAARGPAPQAGVPAPSEEPAPSAEAPSAEPVPSAEPSAAPSAEPLAEPSGEPSAEPSGEPSAEPSPAASAS
jgi:NADH:ubiquinone oxidoreductase subunit 2 (subunit N)